MIEVVGGTTDQQEQELARYAVLTEPVGRDLQALVDLAAQACDVPSAAINIITRDQQHQIVATAGIAPSVCSRSDSMCAAVMAERDAVVARVNDFATTYNTYDVADLASYQKRMKPLLTPAYDKEFVRVTNAVFGALESKDQKSGDANVLAVAVDSIDKDSAIAIVAVDASITTSSDETAVQRRFRWKVTLSKSDGDWRVSQFDTVVPLDASTDPGSGGASPSPSASPLTTPAARNRPTSMSSG